MLRYRSPVSGSSATIFLPLFSGRFTKTHSLGSNLVKPNRFRVIVYSIANKSIKGTSGAVVNITLKADDTLAIRDYTLKLENITSLDVAICADKGDELSKEIYEFTGNMLGEACANFAAFSSPEAFVFFGGLTKAGDLLLKPIRESYERHVLNLYKGKVNFLVSSLEGSSAAVLGASAVGWNTR